MKLHHRSTHRAFETRCTGSTWVNRPRAMLCMMHFRRRLLLLLLLPPFSSSFLSFSFFFPFFFLLLLHLYGTPCAHTKVERDARNGRRKLLRSGSLFDRGTEFRPGAWPLGKCVRDPRCRFPVGNGREDRFSPFNDLSPWFRATTRSKILINRTLASPLRDSQPAKNLTRHGSHVERRSWDVLTMISFVGVQGRFNNFFFDEVQCKLLHFFSLFQVDTRFSLLEILCSFLTCFDFWEDFYEHRGSKWSIMPGKT